MERVPRQQYTTEFREQAVQLVLEQKLPIPEAARRLTMSGNTLKNWVGRARRGQLATLGESRRPETELSREPVPDETTICKFRHLLETHQLGQQLFARIGEYLTKQGLQVS